MNIEITEGKGIPVSRKRVEIVERKGKGHPDSLADKAAEELSIKLSEFYLDTFGRVLHHNVDKCVIAGGQSSATFGNGEVVEPIYLLLVGRAVGVYGKNLENKVPIGKFAVQHTKEWLKEDLPHLDVTGDIIIDYKIRQGSTDLVGNFEGDIEIPRANDTSFGVAYAPLTDTEKIVFETEQLLNSPETKKKYPQIGEDIKVMGVRRGDNIHLTVAAAIISTEVKNPHEYQNTMDTIKDLILDLAPKITTKPVEVTVNNADDPKVGLYYLTVTGTSAEHGDDGQVGRGNRANGLITPYRPMTLEAAAGKNPVSHVGKTYNVAAKEIVDKLIKEEPDIEQAYCYLVSQIGAPITEPFEVNLEIYSPNGVDKIRKTAEGIIEETLEKLPKVWKGFIKREYRLW